mmetsp:Transcript_23347/g.59767  ORF Transcript_23347/g.59767 Transcript_23347/m.59767 type:complete len:195 (-) Transcript_23347:1430-2014(-)
MQGHKTNLHTSCSQLSTMHAGHHSSSLQFTTNTIIQLAHAPRCHTKHATEYSTQGHGPAASSSSSAHTFQQATLPPCRPNTTSTIVLHTLVPAMPWHILPASPPAHHPINPCNACCAAQPLMLQDKEPTTVGMRAQQHMPQAACSQSLHAPQDTGTSLGPGGVLNLHEQAYTSLAILASCAYTFLVDSQVEQVS